MKLWQSTRRLLDSSNRSSSPRYTHEEDYGLLYDPENSPRIPFSSPKSHSPVRRRSARSIFLSLLHLCTLRRVIVVLLSIPFLFVCALLWSGVPPSYNDIREFERHLPQHNSSQPDAGMYIRFPGHIWGHGLNNVLQETLLMSYLAYRTNRSFVFEDYTWSHTPLPYTIYDFALRPPRLPLNAFISGPSAGGPMPPSANARAAVSAEHWEKVCPPARRRIVSSKDAPHSAEGDVLIRWWVDTLAAVPDSCVEIDSSSQVVFDRYFFGEPRILSLWDSLITSPILTEFTWSPLVHSAVARNFPMLQPRSAKALMDVSAAGTLDGLVAVHLRRGDYKRHCPRLAGWGTAYMGVNQAPELPDRLDALALANMTGADRHAEYMAHCLPSVAQVAERLRALRAANPGLRRVYVLTNGWGWWVAGLKKKLLEDGWDDMKSSLELVLDEEQSYVAMAVDMAIAEKAEVFLGNGFSSLTSNVVMLRRAKGLAASSNRFL